MQTTLTKLSSAYIALLMIPHDDNFRFHNQDIYARIRDYLAEKQQCSPQVVQEVHEAFVDDQD